MPSDSDNSATAVSATVAFLDRLDGRLDRLELTTVRQQAILEEHIRRSDANEAGLKSLKDLVTAHRSQAVTWPMLGKILTSGLAAAAALLSILKALGKL